MTEFFISDLHLSDTRPEVTQGFFRFLRETASQARALYILGDLFDAWVGDDDDSPLALAVQEALRGLSKTGTTLYVMRGNRDFLLGNAFATATGAQLLADPSLIDLAGRPTLLMHGDSLCTRDRAYMAFRGQMQSSDWQRAMLAKPLAERRELARQLRAQSQTMNSNKAADIMDVTPEEVHKVMHQHGAQRLIHGHTHRPDRHRVILDAQGALGERIVLGDWHKLGWCLRAEGTHLNLESWPLDK